MLDVINGWILIPETSLAWALAQVVLWYGPVVIAVGLLLVLFGPDALIWYRAQHRRRGSPPPPVSHFPPVAEPRSQELHAIVTGTSRPLRADFQRGRDYSKVVH